MAPSSALKAARDLLEVRSEHAEATSGVHFAFGNFGSPKIQRTETLAFHDWIDDRQTAVSGQATRFTFLDSDGPVLVASYADDVYLLRFTDSGVISEQIEPMKPLMKSVAGGLFFRWQDEDRVLWCVGDGHWLAWNLWDLGLSGFPEGPFLRLPWASGTPHRTRGFVRTVRDGNRFRVEHLWQSPQVANWMVRHVSEWRTGEPVESPEVSPNGRHALVFEQRLPQEDASAQHDGDSPEGEPDTEKRHVFQAIRLDLAPAPVEPGGQDR